MRPTFMIIGAMKSGTTSMWQYLNAHPDIFMSYPKEPGFFVEERNWNQGWQWYEQLFAAAGSAKAVGEASTHYTKFPAYQGVASKIATHLPSTRFIYLMREPISRAISHYWHEVNYFDESRSIERALRDDLQYIDFGRYALQLKQYFEFFPREQFYITTFERLSQDTRRVVAECYQFLGVSESFQPPVLGEKFNEGPAQVRKARALLQLVRHSRWWTRIAPLFPQRIKEFAKRQEYGIVTRKKDIPKRLRHELQAIYSEEVQELSELLGCRFSEWTSVCSEEQISEGRRVEV